MQQALSVAQKRDDLGHDAGAIGPQAPIVQIDIHFAVGETIVERGDQALGPGQVPLAVTGREHGPAVGQDMLADAPIVHELQTRLLHGFIGARDLVDEDDPGTVAGQEPRPAPSYRAVLVEARQAGEIDRVFVNEAQVDELQPHLADHLPDDLGLAHAGRSREQVGNAAGNDGR